MIRYVEVVSTSRTWTTRRGVNITPPTVAIGGVLCEGAIRRAVVTKAVFTVTVGGVLCEGVAVGVVDLEAVHNVARSAVSCKNICRPTIDGEPAAVSVGHVTRQRVP